MLKKGDIIFIIVFTTLSIFLYLTFNYLKSNDNSKLIAYIIQDNKIIDKINLRLITTPKRLNVNGDYSQTILVEKNKIRFENATCPDKICVKTGWLSNKGNIAVCLPNKTIIKIQGENISLDGTTY